MAIFFVKAMVIFQMYARTAGKSSGWAGHFHPADQPALFQVSAPKRKRGTNIHAQLKKKFQVGYISLETT
jgi:hypothetical protein